MYNFSQAQIFILFLILGICIGVFFDFFRALRKNFKTTDFVTFIEDIIFMAIVGIAVVNSLIVLNNGNLRFFIILALIFGITFYFLTISKLVFKIFRIFLGFIKKIIFFPNFLIKNNKKINKKEGF